MKIHFNKKSHKRHKLYLVCLIPLDLLLLFFLIFFTGMDLWDCFDLTFSLLGFDFFIMIVFMKRALE